MKADQKSLTSQAVTSTLTEFGAALRGHRLAKRVTHEFAAAECSFSRQTLSRIERGDPSVAVGQIARYAAYLGAFKALVLEAPAVDEKRRRVRLTAGEAKARASLHVSAPVL